MLLTKSYKEARPSSCIPPRMLRSQLKRLSCFGVWGGVKGAQSWTTASVEFCRPEYCSGWPFPPPGDPPNPGMEPRSPALQVGSLAAQPPGKALGMCEQNYLLVSNCSARSLLGWGVTSAPRDNHHCPCPSCCPFKRLGSLLFFLICLPTTKDNRLNDQAYVTATDDQKGMKIQFSKQITCCKHSGQRHIIESFAFLS